MHLLAHGKLREVCLCTRSAGRKQRGYITHAFQSPQKGEEFKCFCYVATVLVVGCMGKGQHVASTWGFKRLGVDLPLSSSRACLRTAFIAFSVHCVFDFAI